MLKVKCETKKGLKKMDFSKVKPLEKKYVLQHDRRFKRYIWTDESLDHLREMWNNNYSCGVMSLYFGCTPELISAKARSIGLKTRHIKTIIGLTKLGLNKNKYENIKKIFKRHRDYSHNLMELKRG